MCQAAEQLHDALKVVLTGQSLAACLEEADSGGQLGWLSRCVHAENGTDAQECDLRALEARQLTAAGTADRMAILWAAERPLSDRRVAGVELDQALAARVAVEVEEEPPLTVPWHNRK